MPESSEEVILKLELRLGELACHWRRLSSNGQLDAAESMVQDYHAVMKKLWDLGWDGETLLPDSELPDRLMPRYFLDRWGEGDADQFED